MWYKFLYFRTVLRERVIESDVPNKLRFKMCSKIFDTKIIFYPLKTFIKKAKEGKFEYKEKWNECSRFRLSQTRIKVKQECLTLACVKKSGGMWS